MDGGGEMGGAGHGGAAGAKGRERRGGGGKVPRLARARREPSPIELPQPGLIGPEPATCIGTPPFWTSPLGSIPPVTRASRNGSRGQRAAERTGGRRCAVRTAGQKWQCIGHALRTPKGHAGGFGPRQAVGTPARKGRRGGGRGGEGNAGGGGRGGVGEESVGGDLPLDLSIMLALSEVWRADPGCRPRPPRPRTPRTNARWLAVTASGAKEGALIPKRTSGPST